MKKAYKGLRLKPPQPDHWHVGSGKATARFGDTSNLNPTGDWSTYKAQDEHQAHGSFDTDCCWIFSTLKPWIMLANFHGYDDFPKDCAERYLAVMADAAPTGGDPHDAAETVRSVSGVVPEVILPFTDDITAFAEFAHPNPMDPVILALGKASLNKWVFGYEWIFPWGSTHTPAEKTQMIADAAKRGTVAYSVDGNYRYNRSKQLTKPVGGPDTHWVTHLKSNPDGTKVFHDQYDPFEETVAKNYDHNAAIVYFLSRNSSPTPQIGKWAAFASRLWVSFAKLWKPS